MIQDRLEERLREALVDAMRAHEEGRRGGAYPHLGQDNDIRRFADWLVDWMWNFAALRQSQDIEATLTRAEAMVDDRTVFIETDRRYRNGWVDAVRAVRGLVHNVALAPKEGDQDGD